MVLPDPAEQTDLPAVKPDSGQIYSDQPPDYMCSGYTHSDYSADCQERRCGQNTGIECGS